MPGVLCHQHHRGNMGAGLTASKARPGDTRTASAPTALASLGRGGIQLQDEDEGLPGLKLVQ